MKCLSVLIALGLLALPVPAAEGSAAPGAKATAARKTEPPQRPPTRANVAYGPHARQAPDFWQADASAPTPLVFHIHGGGWVNGDKAKVAHLERYLAAGISVVSINYRLVTQAILAGVKPPVQWPLHDAARALQFVRSQAAAWNLDPVRIGPPAVPPGRAPVCGWRFTPTGRSRRAPIRWRAIPRGCGARPSPARKRRSTRSR